MLRGTCFATPNLFGDIPESFLQKLDTSSFHFNRYVLKPSKSTPGGSGSNYQSGRSSYPPNKRPRGDYHNSSRGRSFPSPARGSGKPKINYQQFFRDKDTNKGKKGGQSSFQAKRK